MISDIKYHDRGFVIAVPGLLVAAFGSVFLKMALFDEVLGGNWLGQMVFRFIVGGLGLAIIRLGAGQIVAEDGFVVSPAKREIATWNRNVILQRVFWRWSFDEIEKWKIVTEVQSGVCGPLRVWMLRIFLRSGDPADVIFYSEGEAREAGSTLAQNIQPASRLDEGADLHSDK
jgi:hypothetical protein